MTQIERIEQMEKILDETSEASAKLFEALEKYAALTEKYNELVKYYNSDLWTRDFDAEISGSLPEELKCGVLNEDIIYDLIVKNRILTIRMLEIATDNVKNS